MAPRDKSTQNQEKPEQFSAYVVIPSPVFFDRKLSERAKLLYGLISNMSNHRGFCWAKNETMARYLGVDDRTVRRHLSELKDNGHITIDQQNEGGATIRKIRVTAVQYRPDESVHPPGQTCPDRPDNSVHQNNNIYNNYPPIVPPEGDGTATASKKRKRRRQPTGTVDLPPELEESFSRFWGAYPVHKDKQTSRLRWLQLNPEEALVVSILDSIQKLKGTEDWKREIIPLPSTFLYNRRWEDAEELPDPEPEEAELEGGGGRWL